VAKFVSAWESADLDALVALLTDDVFISMPPMPFEYEGRDVVARFCANIFGAGRGSTSCAREPTVSRRSEPTCAPLPASATGSAFTSLPSPATGSPP
jgi:SnoaL-like protein